MAGHGISFYLRMSVDEGKKHNFMCLNDENQNMKVPLL